MQGQGTAAPLATEELIKEMERAEKMAEKSEAGLGSHRALSENDVMIATIKREIKGEIKKEVREEVKREVEDEVERRIEEQQSIDEELMMAEAEEAEAAELNSVEPEVGD